jgi:hypothetical protein
VGGAKQRQGRRADESEQQQQQAQQQSAAQGYGQAYQGCLVGRGYSVTP